MGAFRTNSDGGSRRSHASTSICSRVPSSERRGSEEAGRTEYGVLFRIPRYRGWDHGAPVLERINQRPPSGAPSLRLTIAYRVSPTDSTRRRVHSSGKIGSAA